MKNFIVDLQKEYGVQGGKLECMVMECKDALDTEVEGWCRPAVIIVPGGAYWMVSKREGAPVAANFFARGFQAFVLTYKAHAEGPVYPEQLIELGAAVDYVRKHAKALFVNPDEIFAVGFSAGGHLVGNLAVEYATVGEKAGYPLDCRPTAVGLCYPVIYKEGHIWSFENILEGYSEAEQEKLYQTLNLHQAVTENTPPAFLWSTAEDRGVPSVNTLKYATALAEREIPYELHVYPQGGHGLSTCDGEVNEKAPPYLRKNAQWLPDCADFFRLFVKEKF